MYVLSISLRDEQTEMKKYLQKIHEKITIDGYRFNEILVHSKQAKASYVILYQTKVFMLFALISLLAPVKLSFILLGGSVAIIANLAIVYAEQLAPSLRSLAQSQLLKYCLYSLGLGLVCWQLPSALGQVLLGVMFAQIAFVMACILSERSIWQ